MNGFEAFFLKTIEPIGFFHYFSALPHLLWAAISHMGSLVLIALLAYLILHVGLVKMGPFWMWVVALFHPRIVYSESTRLRVAPNPFISVVVAGLNEEESIANTLTSILNCGYDNLEIIVVDDGSRDDTVRIAHRVAGQVGVRRKRQKIRVFRVPYNSGRPNALNLGAKMAKGEFVAIIDADSQIQYGALHRWVEAFTDPRIGAVAGNIRVLNPEESFVTRLQEVEYASMMTLYTLVMARLNVLAIIPGQGGMFRAKAAAAVGWYDSGLGDDTDLTLRLLKAGWNITGCAEAIVYTHVPPTWRGLYRQRSRWMKNRVRIRASKHGDMLSATFRYGFFNSLRALRNLFRLQEPGILIVILIVSFVSDPLIAPYWLPGMMTGAYLFSVIRFFLKVMISRDFVGTPAPRGYAVVPFMPLYSLGLRLAVNIEIFIEGLHLNQYVSYVPKKIWPEVPRW